MALLMLLSSKAICYIFNLSTEPFCLRLHNLQKAEVDSRGC